MKFNCESRICEVSKKEIFALADFVVNVGYHGVHRYLNRGRVKYVNTGVYGLNFEVWFIKGSTGFTIAVCEGYRNLPGYSVPTELLDEYADSYMPFDTNTYFADFLYRNLFAFK